MSFWGLVQIFVDLSLLASAGFVWVKLHRPAKDDPRMSRGLQLLQSKISVLEDLSDRTETQVTQLTILMEQKCRDIQNTIMLAEKEVQKIEAAMGKSLEVAKIFQDKIPHQEIIERQNTIKYVKAARMAHQGVSIDEIATQVDLSRGEIEFIAKVNREHLQFSEEDLPEWAKEGHMNQVPTSADELMEPLIQKPMVPAFAEERQQQRQQHAAEQSLSNLGAQFRQALNGPAMPQSFAPPVIESMPAQNVIPNSLASQPHAHSHSQALAQAPTTTAVRNSIQPKASGHDGVVRKVVFPKIEVNNNLG